MSEHYEDPAAHAGARAVAYITLAATALESVTAARAARADTHTAGLRREAGRLRGAHRATHTAARLQWQPVLRGRPGGVTAAEAGTAWAAAQGWREHDPEAAQAARAGEQRLRELDPAALTRIDRLRATGLDDVDALQLAAPALDDERARADAHADVHATEQEARLRRSADGEQQHTEASRTVGDDPATPHVVERDEARQAAAASGHTTDELVADARAVRSAAELAAEGFPLPLPPSAAARRPAEAITPPPAVPVRALKAATR